MRANFSYKTHLAHVDGFDDLRQFALHRIQQASLSQQPWQEQHDFDIDSYIKGGAFGYRQGPSDVVLEADIARPVAWLLQETPLSDTQTIDALPDTDGW
nr:WYL domain-containing protein [Halomonas sp. GFAJ-1]